MDGFSHVVATEIAEDFLNMHFSAVFILFW